ncbi:site-specific DNA-methyltransferase [Lactobacillus sp. 0.1XD8-4]|uniref:Methyltransferase n=1 Tax=Limosilactobacillus walteri TaxID=2268022 RepID=A0ABR8P3T0_9LACO|nr:site-specific DNA-methyltransferase [Limosilactobacillus walteri]MBD5805645.1 site-specific DNA-methyltransferase [Limosilactobacillus walteri]MRN06967.1 site-specific DNA-methyltransferase [Lactobacillus sp. 0.1XD8-4]
MRSKRNKTIDFSLDEASPTLLEQILHPTENIKDAWDRIINGDSFKIMTALSPRQVDLALIDPPYNLNKQYDGLNFKKMTTGQYQKYTQKWIDLLKPLLKDNASVYVFSDWATSMVLAPVLEQNFIIQNRITWQREKGRGSQKNWKNGMEDIWFLTTDPNNYTFNVNQVKQRRQVIAPYKQDGVAKDWQSTSTGKFRDTLPSNFWDDISIPYWSMPENTGHPTQKPEKLLAKIILASSNPGDFVFDPFAGSGSSLVTAAKLNRHYLGIEQSLLYCAWGQYRLNQVKNDQSIQGYTDGVFWERNTLAAQRKIMRHKN